MESFLTEYNELKGVKGIENIATYELFKQPLIEKAKGNKKLINLEDTDQEKVLFNRYGGLPCVGNMYTFFYRLNDIEKVNGVNDKAPIFHCYNVSDQGVMYGLNLNLLPNNVRLKYLETFYKTYKTYFTNVESLTENNKLALNKSFIAHAKAKSMKDLLTRFSVLSKENISYAYRTYKFNSVVNFRLVEYSDWRYIPFFNAKNSFLQNNLSQIYSLYIKSKIKQ